MGEVLIKQVGDGSDKNPFRPEKKPPSGAIAHGATVKDGVVYIIYKTKGK